MKKPVESFRILVINPGSTSTKVAVFDNDEQIVEEVVRHPKGDLIKFESILAQKDIRLDVVMDALKAHGIDAVTLDAVVGRGGLIEPIDSGTYAISKRMLKDLISSTVAVHASALGGILAEEVGSRIGKPSYVVDPIVVDELEQSAKLTGMPGIERRSVFHALNQKAVARRCADAMGTTYENSRFIVAHMGQNCAPASLNVNRLIIFNLSRQNTTLLRNARIFALPVCYHAHME
jgi:butyrate kinase